MGEEDHRWFVQIIILNVFFLLFASFLDYNRIIVAILIYIQTQRDWCDVLKKIQEIYQSKSDIIKWIRQPNTDHSLEILDNWITQKKNNSCSQYCSDSIKGIDFIFRRKKNWKKKLIHFKARGVF